jgi:hypothetical protein
MVVSRSVVSGLAVAMAAAFVVAPRAQTQGATGLARLEDPQAVEAQLKQLVRGFEQVVGNAVVEGGKRVQARTREFLPNITLELAGDPLVSGVVVPGVGFVFDVQCPNILETGLALVDYYLRNQQLVVPTGRVIALPPDFDASREYGNHVRDTLMDAMVDFSGPMPIDDSEWLVVVARVPQEGRGGPSRSLNDDRKLVLQIRGGDLRRHRSGAISKTEVKALIKETRF